MSLHNKDANKNAASVKQPKNQTNTDGEDREDGEDHFHTIAIRHTQHVRLKGPEPRWSDIIMTVKEKQRRQQANTFCAHSKTLEGECHLSDGPALVVTVKEKGCGERK